MANTGASGVDHRILDPKPAQLWSRAATSFTSASDALDEAVKVSSQGDLKARIDGDLIEVWRNLNDCTWHIRMNVRWLTFAESFEEQSWLHELFQRGVQAMRRIANELLPAEDTASFDHRFDQLDKHLESTLFAYARVTRAHVMLQKHQELVAREAACFWPGSAASWPKMEHEFARRMEPLLQARDGAFDKLSSEKLEAYLETVDSFFSSLLTVAPTESETLAALPLHEERMKLTAQLEAAVLLHELEVKGSPVRDTVATSQNSGEDCHG